MKQVNHKGITYGQRKYLAFDLRTVDFKIINVVKHPLDDIQAADDGTPYREQAVKLRKYLAPSVNERRKVKGFPGCARMYSVIDLANLSNTSENTSSSFRLETMKQFSARFFTGQDVGELAAVAHEVTKLMNIRGRD